ncbi:MAG: MgtC/SapB family protein [Patescibacteria group bacterium]|jgi:putative Mg2+ transporter-C (MgtC) family protein
MALTLGQIIFRLVLAAVLSAAIGLEREYRHKPAGLRTNILVAVGSTLVMLTSIYAAGITDQGDITRIASGVLTGIGFLGAGVIMRGRSKDREDEEIVQGITTAATIWIVAAIGLAVGLGFYSAAIFSTLIALLILFVFNSERIRDKLDNLDNLDQKNSKVNKHE